jgi:hypothetical protein
MKLNKRERILAIAAGATVTLFVGGWLLFAGDGRSLVQLRAERDKLAAELQGKEQSIEAARSAAVQLAGWQRRSLPSDLTRAHSLYHNWLCGLADGAHFGQLKVDATAGQSRQTAYTLLKFTVHARSTIGQLTQFLYEFYSAGHLHLIRKLAIKRVENSENLDVTIDVEALALPQADAKDRLTTERGSRLKLAKLSEYKEPIVQRNLFTAYSPPKREERRPEFDALQYTYVTAILESDGRGQVWLMDRTAGKTWMLQEGEDFQVGSTRGSVKTIGHDDVVVEIGGREQRLRYGDSLRGSGGGSGAWGASSPGGDPSSSEGPNRSFRSRGFGRRPRS